MRPEDARCRDGLFGSFSAHVGRMRTVRIEDTFAMGYVSVCPRAEIGEIESPKVELLIRFDREGYSAR